MRLQKLTSGGRKREISKLQQQIVLRWRRGIERLKLHADQHIYDPELESYRWMSEELRVALFAQNWEPASPFPKRSWISNGRK